MAIYATATTINEGFAMDISGEVDEVREYLSTYLNFVGGRIVREAGNGNGDGETIIQAAHRALFMLQQFDEAVANIGSGRVISSRYFNIQLEISQA